MRIIVSDSSCLIDLRKASLLDVFLRLTDTTRHALRSPKERPMPYQIAGIDVHKKMLAVAVADVEVDGDFQFERQKVGTTPADLRRLADWLVAHEVEEVV